MSYDLEKVKTLLSTPEGHDLRDYLRSELFKLRLIDTILQIEEPFAQAVELRGQQKAYEHLHRILEQAGALVEPGTPGRDPRDSYRM